MFITKGHFLSPYARAYKNEKLLKSLHSLDTDLMVAIRIVGFDEQENTPILDLVKVDKIVFAINNMPSQLEDLLPNNFERIEEKEDV